MPRVAVATLLADLHLDVGTLSAALLHDVVEDTAVDLATIERFQLNPVRQRLIRAGDERLAGRFPVLPIASFQSLFDMIAQLG